MHTVAASGMDINNGEVTLTDASGFQPVDKIDTYLVTHGQQLPVSNITVGGGN